MEWLLNISCNGPQTAPSNQAKELASEGGVWIQNVLRPHIVLCIFFLLSPLTSVSNLCRNPGVIEEPPVTTHFLRWLLPSVTVHPRKGPILKYPLTSLFYIVHKEIPYQNLSDPWIYKIFPFNRTQPLKVERDAHIPTNIQFWSLEFLSMLQISYKAKTHFNIL